MAKKQPKELAGPEAGNPEPPKVAQGESRRSFLAKLGLGAAALAVVTSVPFLRGGSKQSKGASGGFPGEESIFHPAQDPRLDSRRKG